MLYLNMPFHLHHPKPIVGDNEYFLIIDRIIPNNTIICLIYHFSKIEIVFSLHIIVISK